MQARKRIAVNTRFLIKNKLEGIGLFTAESLKRMVQAHPDVDFYFLFDRAFDPEFIFANNVKPVVLFPQARHPLLWLWWFELSVAGWLNKHKPDLFLSTDGYGCLRTEVPQVIVMHDLAFEHFKYHVAFLTRKYYEYFTPRFAHKAARIATVSEFSKRDITKQYGVLPNKIDVVYNGSKEVYQPVSDEVKQQIKAQYADGNDYFIYVGSIHPRKNVKNLLLAFDKFKAETGSAHKLVIVGRKAWDFNEVEDAYNDMKFKAEVKFLGHVPADALGNIVASAFAMVYVSLFEGFGIPIVEAMSCDVPVITSNITSMPEAAGDAALLVNPASIEDISSAMKRFVSDPALREQLIVKGRAQVKKFSWDLTAQKLWACCAQVLK
ncbi:MAG TPA: glycosyltransferase family 1 protein [Chitinophagales bacterium]|nr:glycosyltransferase family 1 protein [Chitinophagales bacterium]